MPANATPCDEQRSAFGRHGGASPKRRAENHAAVPGTTPEWLCGERFDAAASMARAIRAGKAQRVAQEMDLRQAGHDAPSRPKRVGRGIAPIAEHG